MAGEDPGVGTLSVILELIQRTGSAITGTIKSGISFSLDVVKTGMFFAWRRQMMQSQKGPDLVHGKQSLKKLRLHEQVGAEIVSVNIGDKEAMKALDAELKRLKIDYAITNDGGKDKTYTLHYKKGNERAVMLAQANAMHQRFGNPDRGAPEHDDIPTREAAERAQQARQQQEAVSASEQVQPEGTDHERGRAEQRESIGAAKAERATSQPVTAYGAAKAVPMDELQQKLNEFKVRDDSRAERPTRRSEHGVYRASQGRHEAIHSADGSLDDLKRQAKERARSKNLARQRNRQQSRDRSMTRGRSRGLELG